VVGPSGLGELRTFGRLPEVNPDDPASWQRFHQTEAQRVSGGRAGVLDLGAANPWAVRDGAFEERIAVGWALQQNPHAQYDADRRTFFVADAAGNQRDIATLDDIRQVVHANGGFHNSNGAAMQAVGAALTKRVEATREPGEPMAAVIVGAAVEGEAALAATAGQGRDRGLETMLARFLELLRSLFGGSGQAGGATER
jgi:hypothetical protein